MPIRPREAATPIGCRATPIHAVWSRFSLLFVAFVAAPQPTCASYCEQPHTWRLELVSSTACGGNTAQPCSNPLGDVGQVDVYEDEFAFAFHEDAASSLYLSVAFE